MFKDKNKLSKLFLVAVLVLCASALIITLARCGSDDSDESSAPSTRVVSYTEIVTDDSGNTVIVEETKIVEENHNDIKDGDVEMDFGDLD